MAAMLSGMKMREELRELLDKVEDGDSQKQQDDGNDKLSYSRTFTKDN